MKLTTPSKKEDILNAIYTLYKDVDKVFASNPNDRYNYGRYTAMLDLLQMVKIYDKEDNNAD